MEVIEKTSREDQQLAKSSMPEINRSKTIIRKRSGYVNIKIKENRNFFKVPKKAMLLLFEILDNMAMGKSITLIPSEAEVSTQQAADMLNVSRPHLVKLLEKGEIPFKKVGSHRRIQLKDLINYDKKIKQTRSDELDFIAEQAQDLNLGY